MRTTLLFFGLLFLANAATSQNIAWVKQGKAPKTEYGNAVTTDNVGNLYVTGTFQDSVRFGSILLTDAFGDYCVKYDTLGNVIWAKKNMGGDGIAFDGSANLYMFNDNAEYLQKVDLSGNLVWNKDLFNSSIFGSNGVMNVLAKGSDIYVTGYFSGDAYFTGDTLINKGNWDIFLEKIDPAGNFVWAKGAGGPSLDKGYSLYVDNADNIYATGYFRDSADFNGTMLTGNGNADIYLAKYDPSGNLSWVNNYGGTGFDLGGSICSDDNGYLYLTGRFNNILTIGTETLYASGTDVFILKSDLNGNVKFLKQISGVGNDEEGDISYEAGKIAFISTTAGTVTLDAINKSGLGNLDICMGEIDTTGTALWMKIQGGSTDDEGNGIVSYYGSDYFCGNFKTTGNFDSFTLNASGQWDIVVGKAGPTVATAVPSVKKDELFSVYPNPANDYIQVSCDSNIEIIGRDGKCISSLLPSGKNTRIDISDLPAGVYIIRSGAFSVKFIRQ